MLIGQLKREKVREMFSAIAPQYDLLNRLLSFKRDRYWRRKAVSILLEGGGERYLDVATGTADIPIEIFENTRHSVKIIGVDFTPEMVIIGKRKIENNGAAGRVSLNCGDGQSLPYRDCVFDGAIIAFGVRNFSDIGQGLGEMKRVTRNGGRLVILEFTHPANPVFKRLYNFYFNFILPLIGGIISGNIGAYRYLPESVAGFPDMEGLKKRIEDEGFRNVRYLPLTFGIAALHICEK